MKKQQVLIKADLVDEDLTKEEKEDSDLILFKLIKRYCNIFELNTNKCCKLSKAAAIEEIKYFRSFLNRYSFADMEFDFYTCAKNEYERLKLVKNKNIYAEYVNDLILSSFNFFFQEEEWLRVGDDREWPEC